jgi:hypothetical protein
MKSVIVICAILFSGCGLGNIQLCDAVDAVQVGHAASAGLSSVVCNALPEAKRKECLKHRDIAVKAGDVLTSAAKEVGKRCEVK